MPDFAIIVCTYNPEEAVLTRTLKAIAALEIPKDTQIECVIVDNNSSTPLQQLPYVQVFLQQCPWASIVVESQQGLTFARLAGAKATTAPVLVFIDDDNEADAHYLTVAQHCLEKYPLVAAWGPGQVKVEFLEPVSDWFDRNFRKKFQERESSYLEYGCLVGQWASYYPCGTGLILRREVFEQYRREIEAGRIAARDRTGRSLSSGGDVQMVWEATKMGFAAGTAPDLCITHLIPGKRATIDYVKRLTFGAASSYARIVSESFPDKKPLMLKRVPPDRKILTTMMNLTVRRTLKRNLDRWSVDLAEYLGEIVGSLRLQDPSDRHWIYHLVRWLQLE